MPDDRPLYVTRPALPPLAEVLPLLEDIWHSHVLSNDGPYHLQFENALGRYLGTDHVSLVTNATLGLQLALRQARLKGSVVTTPFSFVATSHALALAGLEPVFADIDPITLNLDPAAVEAAVTPETSAVLPVHIFGRGCDTSAFAALADRHNLKLIYDAAQAFGVGDPAGSLLRHGDMSVLSFHATKVFNTFEGGAVICKDAATKKAVDDLRNFGIIDEVTVTSVGMNAKMNEFCAALGLIQLQHIDDCIARRGAADARYRELLDDVTEVRCLPVMANQRPNYYSFPILIEPDAGFTRDELYERLRAHNIFARRYFYPLISDLPMYRHLPSAQAENLPIAQDIAQRILCLPLFPDLRAEEQLRIVETIANNRSKSN